MTDQQQRPAWALQKFEAFIKNWVAPAMQSHLLDNDENEAERLRNSIRSIAPPQRNPVVGYAVFAEREDRDHASGFQHICLSAVFDNLAQAQNVYDSCIAKAKATLAIPPQERRLLDGSVVTAGELRWFAICAVQQVTT